MVVKRIKNIRFITKGKRSKFFHPSSILVLLDQLIQDNKRSSTNQKVQRTGVSIPCKNVKLLREQECGDTSLSKSGSESLIANNVRKRENFTFGLDLSADVVNEHGGDE